MTNWSYKLYLITEINKDTLPSFEIDNLPDVYNQALLKTTKLTMEIVSGVMKKVFITT